MIFFQREEAGAVSFLKFRSCYEFPARAFQMNRLELVVWTDCIQ